MGKNKHKMIKKEKGSLKQREVGRQNKASINLGKEENEIEYEQGIFQQVADIEKLEDIEKMEDNIESSSKQMTNIECCQGYQGFFYKVKINNYMKLVNTSASKIQFKMIFGSMEANGKTYSSHSIKQSSSLIFSIFLSLDMQLIDQKNLSAAEKMTNRAKEVLNITYDEVDSKLVKYFQKFDINSEAVIWSQRQLTFHFLNQTSKPWENINTNKYLSGGAITLVVGSKNTGKSMFCDYLYNKAEAELKDFCILDLDIGRNRTYPGSVSFQAISANKKQKISLWIGEFSPVNSIPNYLKAISYLFQHYKERFFTYPIVINTMGYLSGVGQLILYQIFNIAKPKLVLIMNTPSGIQQSMLQNIRYNIQTGKYVDRAHFNWKQEWAKTSTRVQKYENKFAEQKPLSDRFQSLISIVPVRSIQELIDRILGGKLIKLGKKIDLYESKTQGKIIKIDPQIQGHADMRIVVLGRLAGNQNVSISGIAFGWNNEIFYDKKLIDLKQIEVGVTTEGIDFEKSFYQITESKLIELELKLGQRINYLSPIMKIFGSKGLRNTPGKKIMPNKD